MARGRKATKFEDHRVYQLSDLKLDLGKLVLPETATETRTVSFADGDVQRSGEAVIPVLSAETMADALALFGQDASALIQAAVAHANSMLRRVVTGAIETEVLGPEVALRQLAYWYASQMKKDKAEFYAMVKANPEIIQTLQSIWGKVPDRERRTRKTASAE
jgi:hypothetical protein